MPEVIELQLWQFLCIYLLLIVITLLMKACAVNKTRLLLVASLKMTVQLVLAGLILTYIFEHPHPAFTVLYLLCMTAFTIYRVLSRHKALPRRFQAAVAAAIALTGICTVFYFIFVVVGRDAFTPQYVIPISGMIMGNTMTGVSLGLKTFLETLQDQRAKVEALECAGASPSRLLLPFVRQALETAMLPTLNSMLGMGIVSLPGMMTGQILAGTLPTTAILYQIAIMIAICAAVTCSCFLSLYLGSRTLIVKDTQTISLPGV